MAAYYISTGAQNCFYTLRHRFDERVYFRGEAGATDSRIVERDYHVCNLSTNREQAIAKARERIGTDLSADFDVNPIVRRAEIDWSVFQAGKYAGRSIHEVREADPGYLCWVCENLDSSRQYAQTVELAKALMARELGERKAEREAHAAQEAASAARRATALAPIVEVLRGQSGDFCASVANDLSAGREISDRCRSIALDIFARAHGRRNSKAYCAALEQAEVLFTETTGEEDKPE